jgi:O-antigen/teichoic acid export membrane protein
VSVGRHTGYNLVGSLIPLAIAVVTVPIYMHLIGAPRYGILTICWGLLGYFGLFDLGLGRAVAYRLSILGRGSPQASADASWTAVVVSATMGLVGAAAFWLAAGSFFAHGLKADTALRGEILTGLPLLIFAVPIAVVTAVLSGSLQGRERFLQTNTVTMASASLSQVVPLVLAMLIGPSLPVVLWGAVGARLFGAVAFAWLCHREYWRGHHPKVRVDEGKRLFEFGGWVTLNGILNPILSLADRLIIGAMIGAHAVAAYTIPYSVAERTSVVPYSLTTALFPKMSAQSSQDRDQLGSDALKVLVAATTVPMLVGIFLAEPLLKVWLGAAYDPRSGGVARVLLINFWAASFSLIAFVRLQASGRPAALTKILLAQMPFYIAAVYAGIHYLGLIGCAWALLARQLVTYVQTSWVTNRRLTEWPMLTLNLGILLIAHFACEAWRPLDWRLGLLAAGLTLISGVSTWRNVPVQARKSLTRFLLAPLSRTAT